jgi:GMP synthase-like glutamine amidotransferase
MRIHGLQHVPFEGLATIEDWAISRGNTISRTLLFRGESLPDPTEFDWLVIMGGPMNVYEEEMHPWLAPEKDLIRRAIDGGKVVLGICLGAQLIADVLGGKVRKNKEREIGWHPVILTPEAKRSETFGVLPEKFVALQWHGDTFEIPPGAIHTAKSEACENQAFQSGRAIGLQFHLEASMESIDDLIKNCSGELSGGGDCVQSEEEIISGTGAIPEMNGLMALLLDGMAGLLEEER